MCISRLVCVSHQEYFCTRLQSFRFVLLGQLHIIVSIGTLIHQPIVQLRLSRY